MALLNIQSVWTSLGRSGGHLWAIQRWRVWTGGDIERPISVDISGPVSVSIPGPVSVGIPGPVTVSIPEPVTVSIPEPVSRAVLEPVFQHASPDYSS